MQSLPCFLCGSQLEKRNSKNDKPYFVCDPCGLQVFVRRKRGIEKLANLMNQLEHQEIYSHANSPDFLRILAINNEINAIKAEIEKITDKVFLFLNDEENAAIEALEARQKVLVSELERLGEPQDED
jgi:hypothetical protein